MDSRFSIKPVISHIVMLGDSLSDRGTMDHRYLFGVIPMALLAGLTGKSSNGRFTNGYAWSDDLSSMLVDQFIIRRAEKNYKHTEHKRFKHDATDTSDAIITKPQSNVPPLPDPDITDISDSIIANRYFQKSLENSYTLDNDLYVQYRGRDFVRSYDEGGLSSHNYRYKPSISLTVFFSRLVLSTLGEKRKAMLKHDSLVELSDEQKRKTLIIEWSGANDLITENIKPTNAEADRAVKDRISNAEKLIRKGYRHFIFFNLPDLSLTPKFQNMKGQAGIDARNNAHAVCEHFNAQLKEKAEILRTKHRSLALSIEVYDVSKIFSEVYQDTLNQTDVYQFPIHFDKDKLNIPWVNAPEFSDKNHLSPATGYMFWNDVHPSADMHALLANEFYKTFNDKYIITAPKPETPKMLLSTFRKKLRDMQGMFSFFSSPVNIDYSNPVLAIAKILELSETENGKKIHKGITELGWLDNNGKVNIQIPALREAKKELAKIHSQSTTLTIL